MSFIEHDLKRSTGIVSNCVTNAQPQGNKGPHPNILRSEFGGESDTDRSRLRDGYCAKADSDNGKCFDLPPITPTIAIRLVRCRFGNVSQIRLLPEISVHGET